MKISIVIPALNEENTLLKTLETILHFPSETEIIIADGGSTDATEKQVKSFSKKSKYSVTFLSTKRKGRGIQMNEGAEITTGDILLFLHSDTLLPKTAFSDIQNAFTNPKVIGGGFPLRFSGSKRYLRWIEFYSNNRACITKMFHGDQTIFIKRKLFFDIGKYPDIPLMEDVALSRKMNKHGKMVCLPSRVITSSRRIEANGFWKSSWIYIYLKTLYNIGVSPFTIAKIYNNMKKQ